MYIPPVKEIDRDYLWKEIEYFFWNLETYDEDSITHFLNGLRQNLSIGGYDK